MNHTRLMEFVAEQQPKRNQYQELQDENARLHTIINKYQRDIERLRKENIFLQSVLQAQGKNLTHAQDGYGY